jgi:micrococcal nuclease
MDHKKPIYIYKAELKRVIDGDTVDLVVDAGFYISVHQRFRLKGIDTPEIFGVRKETEEYKKGIKAKEYVEKRFKENNGECIIRSHRTGKYGRWIAEIWFLDSDKSLNQELLDEGLADEYE